MGGQGVFPPGFLRLRKVSGKARTLSELGLGHLVTVGLNVRGQRSQDSRMCRNLAQRGGGPQQQREVAWDRVSRRRR